MIELFKNSIHKIFYIRQYNKMMDITKKIIILIKLSQG